LRGAGQSGQFPGYWCHGDPVGQPITIPYLQHEPDCLIIYDR
jgi:hypothetical protein